MGRVGRLESTEGVQQLMGGAGGTVGLQKGPGKPALVSPSRAPCTPVAPAGCCRQSCLRQCCSVTHTAFFLSSFFSMRAA